ncbi:histidine kinase [Pseudonocardia nematodicida]|uniref:histidine kinase n=1 Tax=Pseudonocardia nematodicida TaxID=1206997 RepID=A0ABV1KBI8_9PSEU
MTGPTVVLPRAPGTPARPLLFTVEVFGYLAWLTFDVLLGASLSGAGNWEFASPLSGAVVAAVVLTRYRYPPVPVAFVAFVVSAVLSVLSAFSGLFATLSVPYLSVAVPAPSLTELFALAVVTVAAIRHGSGTAAVAAGAVSFVVIVAVPILRFGFRGIPPEFVVLAGVGWAGTVGVAAVLREIRLRRAARLERARSDERMELARELHDVVAHHVTGIVVAAQAAVTVARTRPEEAGPALESIERAGAEALAGMRRMVGVLRGGDDADHAGERAVGHGPSDVDELVARFDPAGDRTVLDRDPDLTDAALPPGVGETAYRVVQESLTNVHRHASDATTVHVGLRLRDGALEVAVRNEGGSGDRRPLARDRGGFGLAGMAERVGALGGTLRVGPDGPGSWLVLAELPVAAVVR